MGMVDAGGFTDNHLTLTADSLGSVTLEQPSVVGPGYSIEGTTCGPVLSAATSCTITVRLAVPGGVLNGTEYPGTLNVLSNSDPSILTAQLTGRASAATASIPGPVLIPAADNGKNNLALAPPLSVSAWVNMSDTTRGFIFSLSPYVNMRNYSGYSHLYHTGIGVQNGSLVYADRYYDGFASPAVIAPFPTNVWTHVATEVDANFLLRVSINGQFVFSKQLSSAKTVTGYKVVGGDIGIGDANWKYQFPSAGALRDIKIWNTNPWGGVNFVPPSMSQ